MTNTSFARLDGSVAAVTGAAGGIGWAVAVALHEAGAKLVLADMRLSALRDRVNHLDQGDDPIAILQADVSERPGAESMVDLAIDRFGTLSILVNVVGGLKGAVNRSFTQITEEQWDYSLRVNLRTCFLCTQFALAAMIPARSGRIVNIASTAWAGSPDHTDYAVAKAGVVALTRSVATQVAQFGITVNAVAPGPTLTEALISRDARALDVSAIPLGRANEPSDVASAVRFLCSDEARNVSGHVLAVAGGVNPSL